MRSFVAAALLIFGTACSSDARNAAQDQDDDRPFGRVYDPKTVETLQGEVARVERVPSAAGASAGIHVWLKTEKETIPVHLGPEWYWEKEGFPLKAGDPIAVRGSRISSDGKPALIAASVKRGDRSVTLRDETGRPKWAGGRGR